MRNVFFTILCVCLFSFTAIASEGMGHGVHVTVRIESYNKTLLNSAVDAYLFKDAVQKVTTEEKMPIEFNYTASSTVVHAINGIENGSLEADGEWLGFIIRNNKLLLDMDYLEMPLENGDEVVLYYGSYNKTEILAPIDVQISQGMSIFTAAAENARWTEKNGSWSVNQKPSPAGDIKIHITLPNRNVRTLKTDSQGKAQTSFHYTGVYKYYGEAYNENALPSAVRTKDAYFFYGAGDHKAITRSEAAAFIVNTFMLEAASNFPDFTDVSKDHYNYSQIMQAASGGIISGYGDGTFRPDEPVNLLQLAIMISNAAGDRGGNREKVQDSNIPSWAVDGVEKVLAAGYFEGITLSWQDPVSVDTMIQIYKNIQ